MTESPIQPPLNKLELDFLERALDHKELTRAAEVVARAAAILGRDESPSRPRRDRLAPLIAELEAWLDNDPAVPTATEAEAHQQQLERIRERFAHRREALLRAETAATGLREITVPATMLAEAPRRLCEGTRLDRVLLSTVHSGAMVATSAHFEDDPSSAAAALAKLAERPIRLEHPLLEAEMIRRRRATIVVDASLHPRVDARLTEAMHWTSYLVAPVFVRGRVIAVLHGDLRSEQPDVLDRECLWRFAVGLADAYERATLRRLLRREREQMRGFLDRLNVRLGELSDSTIRLSPGNGRAVDEEGPTSPPPRSRHSALGGLLTPREAEVLALMANGLGNRQIADQLVISEATVKFHVNRLLKKLRAENRAEAVSRYLTSGGS